METGNISLVNIFCLFLNKDLILQNKAHNFFVYLIYEEFFIFFLVFICFLFDIIIELL